MVDTWKSIGLYEHPEKHQAGAYGNVALSPAGVYVLRVGGSHMSCPQDWAAAIHAEETGQTGQLIVRNVPELLRRELKAKAAQEGRSMQAVILELIARYVGEK
jgi:hypothetical protein